MRLTLFGRDGLTATSKDNASGSFCARAMAATFKRWPAATLTIEDGIVYIRHDGLCHLILQQ